MEPKLSPAQADPHQDSHFVSLASKDWTDTEEALSKLAHMASDRRPAAVESDFIAGPRMTEPSPDTTLRRADVSNGPLPTDRRALGRRSTPSRGRFLLAACVGVAAAVAWQFAGGAAMRMMGNSAPQLGLLLSRPSGHDMAVEQPSPPVVQAAAPQAAPPQAAALPAASAQTGVVASAASDATASTAPANPPPDSQQLETMSHELAAVRESVEQLAAGQEQMAREIAKLQTDEQEIRRRMSALPPAAARPRKPVPPQSGLQSSANAPLPSAPSQPAPQSSAAPPPPPSETPLRPPMPVR